LALLQSLWVRVK